MGLSKSKKSLNITICVICGIVIIASIVTACVILWPRDKKTYTISSEEPTQQDDGNKIVLVDQTCLSNAIALGPTEEELNNINLAVQSANKTIQMYDAELKCYEGTDTDMYAATISEIKSNKYNLEQLLANSPRTNSQTYTRNEQQTTTTQNYNVPSYSSTPATTIDCSEYHSRYYSQYTQKVNDANRSYNSAVQEASVECASRGGGFSGCTSAAEQRLKAQLNSKIGSYKIEYRQSMSNAGCNPDEYVSF